MNTSFLGEAVALRGRLDRSTEGTVLVVSEIAPGETDCTLADLSSRRDNEIVAVWGIVAEEKTVHTRAGAHVMFAQLRDGDTCIDALIFAGAIARAGLL